MTALRAADNPFRADRIEALTVRPRGWTWESLIERLATLGNRGAVVGGHGHGKTTFLEELERRLPNATLRINLAADEPRPLRAALAAGDVAGRIVLLDRSEKIGPIDWQRLRWVWRRAAGIVIARHRPGRLPTLVHLRTSAELLEELALELAPDLPTAIVTTLPEIFARHHGNIRECLRELYDRYAEG